MYKPLLKTVFMWQNDGLKVACCTTLVGKVVLRQIIPVIIFFRMMRKADYIFILHVQLLSSDSCKPKCRSGVTNLACICQNGET